MSLSRAVITGLLTATVALMLGSSLPTVDQAMALTVATPPACNISSGTGGFTLDGCVPEGLAGRDTVKKLDVAGVRDLVNRYIVVLLVFLASMAVAIILFKAGDIVIYASNDGKRKEALKAIQWVLLGLLGATLAYMIITSVIRGFYLLGNG